MCLPIIRASRRLGQGCSPWAGSLGQVPVGTSPSAMCCPVPRGTLMSTLPTSEGGLKARLAGKAVQTPDKPTGCPEQQVHRSVPHTHVHTNTGARHTRAHPLEPRRPGRSTAINHSNLAGIWEPLCRAHT